MIQSEAKSQKWKEALARETAEYLFNFAFFAIFLVAFTWYRRLILAAYHIQYLSYWAPLIEAAILAKIIMIGDVLRIGRRFQSSPLLMTALYRAVVFTLLVIIFSFVEHIIGAKLDGKTVVDGIAALESKGIDEILANCIVIFAAFLPFFAFKEIEAAFGRENVRRMLLTARAKG